MSFHLRDLVCALLGCRKPKAARYAFFFACERCGRVSFVEARKAAKP